MACPICGLDNCQPHLGQPKSLFIRDPLGDKRVLRLTERLYLNHDKTKVVRHGDPDAAFLLGPVGALISEEDAKRLGVSATEELKDSPRNAPAPVRANLAMVPVDTDDDKMYDDQTERGVEARKLAREMARQPIAEYVLSTGGSEEEAETAAAEATGEASPKGPTVEEQRKQNNALVGKGK